VGNPTLVSLSPEVADLLDLRPTDLNPEELAAVFSGNQRLPGMETYATCYGGHQFGNWAGQLGDGRAIGLGEVVNQKNERWELQLKGAGITPYSRGADGRAVLRSSLREYLCSEAMHHLGVPTTRALCLVNTGDAVVRDMLYDGHAAPEPGAIVCRVSPSFIRFGNFEICAARKDDDLLRQLANYTIETHFPHLGDPSPAVYAAWFKEVCEKTAHMVVHWSRVGFVHGVMNTDNMSILGLTMDYGPYGWLEGFDLSWTPNTTDAYGRRYAFGNQPRVASWNLFCLANALYGLIGDAEILKDALGSYGHTLGTEQRAMLSQKFGFPQWEAGDETLVDELMEIWESTETDMTIFHRRLADVSSAEGVDAETRLAPLLDAYYAPDELQGDLRARTLAWLESYATRVRQGGQSDSDRAVQMNAVNPKYVPRNYLAQLAIDKAEQGDASTLEELMELFKNPYDEQPEREEYAAKRPEWARHKAGCSMLSCSS